MSGHSFKQLVFEQFFPDAADEVEEIIGQQQPAPIVVPVPDSEHDIEDTAEKDDVQVTESLLPDETTPAATDVAPPESSFLEDYEDETGYESDINDGNESHSLSQGSVNHGRLSTIPEETKSEGPHDDSIPVSNQDESVGPDSEGQTDAQTTEQHEESSQMLPEDPAAPGMPTDSSPTQLGPESFPPLYFTPDRTRIVTLAGTSGGIAPSSYGQTFPESAQEDAADDKSEDGGWIVIGNDD
ncbi:hypothetical protein QBC32DRAFT_319678 [Pseudoneurospora amorphoporcata]|uniref:Uncharacterized protein n=1 Tax=Pseudoneurospora amorphoporcata TaxID=241081 RepID=A0AAN6SAQ8_9PEZI|nr:hypothetical protein QBC32DRAFT_319678 [Pseudoneurospora amorphoporcata]